MPSYYCKKGIQRVLISQFNPSNLGKGMEKLLNDGNNLLTLVKSTDAITAGSVIKAAKKRADKLTAMTSKTVLPSITTQTTGAQEEANRLNIMALKKVWSRPSPSWLAVTSPIASSGWPMAVTTKALMNSHCTK